MLPARWTEAPYLLRPHPAGEAYSNSPHRFNTVPAGRRSGKTERAKRKLVMRAMRAAMAWEPRYFAAAPTRDHAKQIFWEDLKALIDPQFINKTAETGPMIRLVNGAEIWIVGMDKPERIEGRPWDGGVVDEIANMKPNAWPANIRPALSDRLGWCDLIGVPEGRNHYYELDRRARALMQAQGAASEWGSFSWPSSDVLSAEEVAAARLDVDELTFLQEYEASFVNFEGRCYYPFQAETHTAPLGYDPKATLAFCFDFNVDPGVAAVCQEQEVLPRGTVSGTGVIGEVHIPRNSNTPAVCRRLIADWGKHPGRVICYGDPSGGARGTAKVSGSDWDLIKAELRPVFGERLSFRVRSADPGQRPRINAVNTRLKNGAGQIRLMVDPLKAPNVVRDFDGVALLKGGSGEIDKKRDARLSHLTDAVAYYIEYEFPVQATGMQRIQLGGI